MYLKNSQNFLYQTLDACLLTNPPKMDILRTYAEVFNSALLQCVQSYWKNCYENLNVIIDFNT